MEKRRIAAQRDGKVMPLRNDRMKDGSRHFGSLPQTVLWDEIRNHTNRLSGAEAVNFLCDDVTEAWVDFSFQGYRFTINDQLGEYWFFVQDSRCPDTILQKVLKHFEGLLDE